MLTRSTLRRLKDEDVPDEPNRLRRAMALVEITQDALADAIDIPQSTISKIVNGQMPRLPLAQAQRLAEFFGCQTDDLFPAREAIAS
jgi:DNA-binding XRE family transcriptional regulator